MSEGGCWTLPDILLDAPEPRVAARGAEECRERAARGLRVPARLACCDRSDLERCWRGCAADPGDCALVMNTLGAKLTHGM